MSPVRGLREVMEEMAMSIPTADISSPRNGNTPEPELLQQVRIGGAAGCSLKSGLPTKWSHSAPWRQAVQRRRIMLMTELERLDLSQDPKGEAVRRYLVDDLLADANRASCAKVGFLKWWWGTEIERAWARLREVAEQTVDLVGEAELPVFAAHAAQRGEAYLDADDPRLDQLQALRRAQRTDSMFPYHEFRIAIVEVLRAAHARADYADQEARYLRNRLLIASGFCVLFAALIVGVQSQMELVKFIEHPDQWQGPSWRYLCVVMLFGMVGSLFTAVPAVSKIPTNFCPFNLPLQQGLLKVAFGPLAAVIGLAILSAGIVAVQPKESLPQMLLMAALFGAGQHAVTRYVDQRAGQILTAASPAGAHSKPDI